MKLIEALADSRVFDRDGGEAYRLCRGERYVLHDCEADRGLQGGALRVLGPLSDVLPRYVPGGTESPRLLLPFAGRLGDALVTCHCVRGCGSDQCADVTIAATGATRRFLQHVDAPIECIAYPVTVGQLAQYSHHLTLEGIDALPNAARRSLGDLFGECLGMPPQHELASLRVSRGTRERWHLDPLPSPRVGIQLTPSTSPRTYPLAQALELARLLVTRRVSVVLLGRSEEIPDPLPHHPPWINSFVGQTRTVEELAAVIDQLDLLVSPDSLLMHVAASLGTPNLVIFTSTDSALAADYPQAHAMSSGLACSPCGVAQGSCPEGYGRCAAHDHPDLRPARIARVIASRLMTLGRVRCPRPGPVPS